MTSRLVGRLTVPIAALSLLLVVIAIGSAWYVRSLQQSSSDLVASNVASMQAAQELEISIREVRTHFTRSLFTKDEAHLKRIPALKQRTADALAAAERTASTPEELVLMKRVRAGYQHFLGEYELVVAGQARWKNPEVNRPLHAIGGGLTALGATEWEDPRIIAQTDTVFEKEILEPAHEYLRLNEGVLTSTTAANQRMADQITTGLVALGLCGAAGGVLGGMLLAAAVRKSLQSAEARLLSTAAELGLALPPGAAIAPEPEDPVERMRRSAAAVLDRLRQTERDALRAEQLAWVGQMAAGIAHEVRNPLMAIKLLVQTAAERSGGGPFKSRDLQVLEEEILRLEQIVSGFLDFARPPRLDPRPVDVRELVERTADGVRARASLQGVDVRVETGVGPAVVSADQNQVRQVLYNLLFNALDAQPSGGHVTVRVGMDRRPAGEPELVVAVADGGPGLPPELREKVFEPFVSTKESGLGLGLSICRRIAETHGGGLTADSSPRGATFTLRLPIMPPSSAILSA